MALTGWTLKNAAGDTLSFAADLIAGVYHEIGKMAWGAEDDMRLVSNADPIPTADMLVTIVAKSAATVLADDTSVPLPGLPDEGDRAGVFAVLTVSSGTALWSWGDATPDDPLPSGTGITFPSGAQLGAINIAGPATVHVTYYRAGEVT